MGARAEFFEHASARLYAVIHPAETSRGVGAVIVHPFMEERQDSHPVLRSLAERLAREGYPSMRFDLTGCGDSWGDWSDGTVARWLDDIEGACARLREATGVTEVALVGLRFGATLAALAAPRLGAAALAMVQPVVKGAQYAMDLLRANLAAEMVLNKKANITREVLIERLGRGESVNIFGYDFTPAQWEGLQPIDLAADLARYAGPMMLLDVVRTPTAGGSNELRRLAATLGERASLRRAVEAQPLYTEGKVRLARSVSVEDEIVRWLADALRERSTPRG